MSTWLAGMRPAGLLPVQGSDGDSLFRFDRLRSLFLAVHGAVIVYVSVGWLIPSRLALYLYLLLLPLMVMQWILNGGGSILNNFENLIRFGRWNDSSNRFEGALFRTCLARFGVRASQGQITTVLCSLMLFFWIAALCRMVLIVVPVPA